LLHGYPGINGLLCRYTQDDLDAQLRPEFYKLCPPDWLSHWGCDEDSQSLKNGSRLYLRALRSSDEATRYGKFRGLTLGFFGLDQGEELPADMWEELKARPSQPGTPQQ